MIKVPVLGKRNKKMATMEYNDKSCIPDILIGYQYESVEHWLDDTDFGTSKSRKNIPMFAFELKEDYQDFKYAFVLSN